MSDVIRFDMADNPDKYVGRVVTIMAMERLKFRRDCDIQYLAECDPTSSQKIASTIEVSNEIQSR